METLTNVHNHVRRKHAKWHSLSEHKVNQIRSNQSNISPDLFIIIYTTEDNIEERNRV